MPARSEPLLWVQLIGAGLFPLEGLLLLLLLAGSDPGPWPGLERLLCWALGALAPALLLWRRPADVWSLLLLQTPLRARRPLQQRLSRLQDNLGLRLGLALAALISLPLLGWLDEHAAVASSLSPLDGSPRLVVLLLAALLLAVMQWQWQQLLQALWLLTRSPDTVASAEPMSQADLEQRRLCLGLPLLLLDPLSLAVPQAPAPVATAPLASATAAPPSVEPAAAAAPPADGVVEGPMTEASMIEPPADRAGLDQVVANQKPEEATASPPASESPSQTDGIPAQGRGICEQPPSPVAAESEQDAAAQPASSERQPETTAVLVPDEAIEVSIAPQEPVQLAASDAGSVVATAVDPLLSKQPPAAGHGEDRPSRAAIPAELSQEASPGDSPGSASEPASQPEGEDVAFLSVEAVDAPAASEPSEAAGAPEAPGAAEASASAAGGEATSPEPANPASTGTEATD